jgi:hypothetical protein
MLSLENAPEIRTASATLQGIYHAGCTDYPYPNLPMPLQLGQRADLAAGRW